MDRVPFPMFEIASVIRFTKNPKRVEILRPCKKCGHLVSEASEHSEEECAVAQVMGS